MENKPIVPPVDRQKQALGFANRNRKNIILIFKIVYALIGVYYIYGAYLYLTHANAAADLYTTGISFGQAALSLLLLVLIPGMLGRFGIKITATFILTNFRRYLGILMFLFAFTHYSFIKLLPVLAGDMPFVFPYALFEMFGWSAFVLFFCMFLTANEYSYVKLGKWWKRLHRVVYVALWLLVLHIVLQGKNDFWTYLVITLALLETASLIYSVFKKKSPPSLS